MLQLQTNKPMSDDCSLHSWSGTNDERNVGYTWSPCCYKGAKDGKCMWSKSSEIQNQTISKVHSCGKSDDLTVSRNLLAPSFTEKSNSAIGGIPNSFEISIGPGNKEEPFEKYDNATAKSSLKRWKNSPKHLEVMLNQGKWAKLKWNKIGAATYGPFANVWFSE